MPYFATSQEWSEQSRLLLQARPTTTRIVTKYKIIDPTAAPKNPRKRPAKSADSIDASATPSVPAGPRGELVLKTYDPVSGTCLKYKTRKAAEVGRLIAGLGRLGRDMAALPEVAEETAIVDTEKGTRTSTPVPEAAKETKPGVADGKGAGGGKKKKKGKK